MSELKSITKLANEINCDPMILNKAFMYYEIHIKVEFGVNDGFIPNDIYDSIQYNYSLYKSLMVDEVKLMELRGNSVPIEDGCYIYFLYDDNCMVYVGQTSQLLGRMQEHKNGGKKFNNVTVLKTEKKDLLFLESCYIYQHKPKYNCVGDKNDNFLRMLIREVM